MQIMIASDIHGSASCCSQMLDLYEKSGASRMLLLGDILYHGPRNDLPEQYSPREVIEMLNPLADEIWAVRGNCEAEVDQMVLDFPCMADYCILPLAHSERILYATHGHVFCEDHLPPMKKGDALLYGHTHIWTAREERGYYFLNPGSVSLPKNGNERTLAFLEEDVFTIVNLEGNPIRQQLLYAKSE